VLNIYVLLFPFFQRSFGFLFSLPAFSKLIVSYGDAKVRAFIKSSKTFCRFLKFSFSENSYQYFEELVIF